MGGRELVTITYKRGMEGDKNKRESGRTKVKTRKIMVNDKKADLVESPP